MNYRPLGATGISVSEVGLGAWQLGNPVWEMHDTGEALRIVQQALDDGCNFFDTAPGYGAGRSEELLGEALASHRDRVVLCSKFGHTSDGESDFSAAAVQPALEASMRRLRTDYLDVYLLHNPPRELINGTAPEVCEELEKLKTEGKLRAYGVSLDAREELELVLANTRSTAVEVLFNVFQQDALAAFPQAHAQGVGLIAKVPLDSGWLSGKYRAGSRFNDIRERWSPEVIARRAALVEEFAALLPPGLSVADAAIQYILAQSEISTVIPGAKTAEQARINLAASRGALPPEIAREIHGLWSSRLSATPLPW
ncbi:MAG: aldo/keto reductase [Chthoniobacterales bacterium]